ncbi:hypothetical protein [Streptomyces sp. NPDC060194]|uniref:hypothetical protein n=1 Tax=Streptomyces sp. NPDC060194 TaxID=3347069 RepID=UPI003649ABB9
MRVAPSRRIATALACAVLALGAAAPVFAETTDAPAASTADTLLLGHVETLDELGGVLTPVTALVKAALTAEGGTLSAEEARRHTDAIAAAVAEVTPAKAGAGGRASVVPAEVKDGILVRVQRDAEALAAAAQTGDRDRVRKLARTATNTLISFLAATVITEGLPSPALPGLPGGPAVEAPEPAAEASEKAPASTEASAEASTEPAASTQPAASTEASVEPAAEPAAAQEPSAAAEEPAPAAPSEAAPQP